MPGAGQAGRLPRSDSGPFFVAKLSARMDVDGLAAGEGSRLRERLRRAAAGQTSPGRVTYRWLRAGARGER